MALALAAALPALLYAPRLRAAGPPLAVLSPTRAPPRTAVAGCAAAAGPVAAEELSDEARPSGTPRPSLPPPTRPLACGPQVLLSIVLQAMPDQEVNDLTWRCLGYRPTEAGGWDASEVFPNWRKKYPAPPDLVGVTRTYSREAAKSTPVHRHSRPPPPPPPLLLSGGLLSGGRCRPPVGVARALRRVISDRWTSPCCAQCRRCSARCSPPLAPAPSRASSAHAASPPARQVPREHKDRLKPTLRPLGWKGFKMAGLTPNMTRRAQAAPARPSHGHGRVRTGPREAVRPKEIAARAPRRCPPGCSTTARSCGACRSRRCSGGSRSAPRRRWPHPPTPPSARQRGRRGRASSETSHRQGPLGGCLLLTLFQCM